MKYEREQSSESSTHEKIRSALCTLHLAQPQFRFDAPQGVFERTIAVS
jgi:hypothetical protein